MVIVGVLTLLAALVLAPIASADLFSPQSGCSPNADNIDSLYWYIMAVAAVIFFGTEGLLFYTLWKFRASRGHAPKQIRGNTKLEFTWTIAAAVILVVLAVITFSKLDSIKNPPDSLASGVSPAASPMRADGKLNICIDGYQYGWRFIYQSHCPDKHNKNNARNPGPNVKLYGFEEMVVPAGVTVTIEIGSLDVNHAWWIPKLGGKFDATRGYINRSWFRIPEKFGQKPGGTLFYGQCAELCGRNHANMTAQVRALSVPEFNKWAIRRKADIAAGNATLPALGKKLKVIEPTN